MFRCYSDTTLQFQIFINFKEWKNTNTSESSSYSLCFQKPFGPRLKLLTWYSLSLYQSFFSKKAKTKFFQLMASSGSKYCTKNPPELWRHYENKRRNMNIPIFCSKSQYLSEAVSHHLSFSLAGDANLSSPLLKSFGIILAKFELNCMYYTSILGIMSH